jgi:branched-chain amino acid transport system substrate-binding protein
VGSENLFRTVPSLHDQGEFLGTTIGASRVALLRTGDGDALSAGLAEGLTAQKGELVADVTIGTDAAADIQQIVAATPDAVVLAAAGPGPGTEALITALAGSGLAGARLWITGPALTRYDTAAAALEGTHGIQSGAATDPRFVAQVRQEDPGARILLDAADAYDATVLVAIAALLAGDDGGPSITAALPSAAAEGIPCHSFGECADTLTMQPDIVYEGVSGPLAFDAAGDRMSATYARYEYGADGVPVVAESLTG